MVNPLLKLKTFFKHLLTISWVPGTPEHPRPRNFWCDSKHWAYCYTCKRLQRLLGVAPEGSNIKDQLICATMWGGYFWQRLRGPKGSIQYHYKYQGNWWRGTPKRIPFDVLMNNQTIHMEMDFHAR